MAQLISNNLLFIHIPKTGGTSITKELGGKKVGKKHDGVKEIKKLLSDLYPFLFKFAVIRNPWERAFSFWRWVSLKKNIGTFEYWLTRTNPSLLADRYFDLLSENNKTINMEFLIKFETLQEDFNRMCDTVGIQKTTLKIVNTSGEKEDYRKHYSQQMVELVLSASKRDIDYFGYKF